MGPRLRAFVLLSLLAACSRKEPPAAPLAVASAAIAEPEAPPPPPIALERVGDEQTGSRVVLARREGELLAYVADEDARAVRVVDIDQARVVGTAPLDGRPAQMVVAADGSLFVALRDAAKVARFSATRDDARPLVAAGEMATAVEPLALALTPDDATLLVASGWGHALEAFDVETRTRAFALDVAREPRAVVTSSDGKKAWVAHASAGALTSVDLAQRKATSVDLTGGQFLDCEDHDRAYLPARPSRQAFALGVLRGKTDRVVVAHALMDAGTPAARTAGYGGSGQLNDAYVPKAFTLVDVVDAKDDRVLTWSRSGPPAVYDPHRCGAGACLLPRAMVVTDHVYVACMGPDVVRELVPDVDQSPASHPAREWRVGAGPVGMARDARGERLVVFSQWGDELAIVPLASEASVTRVPLGAPPLDPRGARGRALFHAAGDPRIAKDGRACASCHPDGRDDGLVWSTPDGPRQTPTLAGREASGPYGWGGGSATLEEHIGKTVKRLDGRGLDDEDVAALAAYVRALPPPPRAPASDAALVQRGRAVFASDETGCATCHLGKDASDRAEHVVGRKAFADTSEDLRTPPLLFVGGTAPYFHDGRYATLEDLLAGTDGMMGTTGSLPESDRLALLAYLRSL